MIQTTNDPKRFYEEEEGPIYIYGAGNVGRWVARFMEKCGMDFEAFIDQNGAEDKVVLGKPVIRSNQMRSLFGKRRVRVVVAAGKPERIIMDLCYYVQACDLLCLIPVYMSQALKVPVCSVNEMLSYFRKKLLVSGVPTVLSNTCLGAHIYKALGDIALSPTINTYIEPEHFLKLCKNPGYYFSEEMIFSHWTSLLGVKTPVGRVRDIEVKFTHVHDEVSPIERWNKIKEWVQPDNIVCFMELLLEDGTQAVREEFCQLPNKHLIVTKRDLYMDQNWKGGSILFAPHEHFRQWDAVIEEWFDLVGWLNGSI